GGRGDHVLGVAVRGGGGVPEVVRRQLGLRGDLGLGRVARRGGRSVLPHAGQGPTRRVSDVRDIARTGLGARGNTLAVLRGDAAPRLAVGSHAGEERLLERGHRLGVTGVVLVARSEGRR